MIMGSNYYLICYLIFSLTVFPVDVSHDYIKLPILSDWLFKPRCLIVLSQLSYINELSHYLFIVKTPDVGINFFT